MARPGITYTEVAEAASQLVGQNKNPTIEQVRLLLGSGSSTTIANHLRQWKDNQAGSGLLAAKENLPQELIALVKGLWERILDESAAKIHAVEVNYQQMLAEAQHELQKYKHNNQRWQHLFNQWTQEKEHLLQQQGTLEQEKSYSEQQYLQADAKLAALAEQLLEKQQRIDELHRLHQQTQANLEHYRETTREQRILEQQQFDQQKLELQHEIKTVQERLLNAQEKSGIVLQQYQTLQHKQAELEQQQLDLNNELSAVRLTAIENEKKALEHDQSRQHWHKQYKDTQQTLDNKIGQLIEVQTELNVATQQAELRLKEMNELIAQNKALGQEKWLLAQEKAQLEGQIKQLAIGMTNKVS